MHAISVDAAAAVDMVHVADSDSANNTKTSSVLAGITAESDLELVSVTLTAPTAVEASEAFDAKVDASLLNNGPFGPVSAAVTVTLSLPSGCTSEPAGDQAANGISLALDTPTAMPQQTWSVTCTGSGSRNLSADVVLAVDQNHVTDPDDGNDSGTSAVLAVAVGPAGFGPLGGPPLGSDDQRTWPILIPIGLALALAMGLLGQRHRSKLSRRS
jgi:hypothetical protein